MHELISAIGGISFVVGFVALFLGMFPLAISLILTGAVIYCLGAIVGKLEQIRLIQERQTKIVEAYYGPLLTRTVR